MRTTFEEEKRKINDAQDPINIAIMRLGKETVIKRMAYLDALRNGDIIGTHKYSVKPISKTLSSGMFIYDIALPLLTEEDEKKAEQFSKDKDKIYNSSYKAISSAKRNEDNPIGDSCSQGRIMTKCSPEFWDVSKMYDALSDMYIGIGWGLEATCFPENTWAANTVIHIPQAILGVREGILPHVLEGKLSGLSISPESEGHGTIYVRIPGKGPIKPLYRKYLYTNEAELMSQHARAQIVAIEGHRLRLKAYEPWAEKQCDPFVRNEHDKPNWVEKYSRAIQYGYDILKEYEEDFMEIDIHNLSNNFMDTRNPDDIVLPECSNKRKESDDDI